ncbi:MAG TPA: hypothetical protein VHB79_37765 [Polyangiaceae bacterium]|nr:hypothetical protein [Polyangiaceae bacterium]
MLFTRLGTLASLGVLGAALLLSCGTDEGTAPFTPGEGGDNGTPTAGAGNSSTSGNSGGGVLNGGTSSGGTSAGTSSGGIAGNVTPAGGAGHESEAGAGGMPLMPGGGEQLDICARLPTFLQLAPATSKAYQASVYADCRVKWVIPLQPNQALVDYKNRLVTWSLEFWGCQGAPVTDLALVYPQASLSRGDATILIQYYLDVADAQLDLSPPEHAEMKAALECLAAPLIVSDSEEPSQSKCPVNTGSGGAGGAGPDAAAGATSMQTSAGAPSLPAGGAGQGGAP